jgi:hypothetical protein
MADNVVANLDEGGATFATDDIGGEMAVVERATAAALAEMMRQRAAQMAEDDEVLMLL